MNSEISIEENDDQDDNSGTKRCYECTFCKRGFTNAQALGGHMNIHRKDRAKAKQPTNSSSSRQYTNYKFYTTNDEVMSFPFSSEQNIDHHMYFQHQYFPPPNNLDRNQLPSNVNAFPYDQYYPKSSSSSSSNWLNLHLNHQELQGDNLSLQIGPTRDHVDNNNNNNNNNNQIIWSGNQKQNDEVDLELRLGLDP